ncbi:nitrate/nitrite transporter NrtS [Labilibaculum sp.]|uniref:nitrate/nitrite transporter NrtS n=1 Tax=Labilibaculum sp. TaxID=2060723 RepID=UPI0035644BD2
MALVVGTVLGLINHGLDIIANTLTTEHIIQIIITYLVPYSVSTYSSVRSILQLKNQA